MKQIKCQNCGKHILNNKGKYCYLCDCAIDIGKLSILNEIEKFSLKLEKECNISSNLLVIAKFNVRIKQLKSEAEKND